jgi:hypothetical protein
MEDAKLIALYNSLKSSAPGGGRGGLGAGRIKLDSTGLAPLPDNGLYRMFVRAGSWNQKDDQIGMDFAGKRQKFDEDAADTPAASSSSNRSDKGKDKAKDKAAGHTKKRTREESESEDTSSSSSESEVDARPSKKSKKSDAAKGASKESGAGETLPADVVLEKPHRAVIHLLQGHKLPVTGAAVEPKGMVGERAARLKYLVRAYALEHAHALARRDGGKEGAKKGSRVSVTKEHEKHAHRTVVKVLTKLHAKADAHRRKGRPHVRFDAKDKVARLHA